MELYEKAAAFVSWFRDGERMSDDTKRPIRTLQDETHRASPQHWTIQVAFAAHGDMLPDDWRYELIEEAADWLADPANDPDDYEPRELIYNAERLRWLGSHLERAGYCDEAAAEHDYSLTHRTGDGGILGLIALGHYHEAMEVFGLVRSALEGVDDDDVTTYEPAKAAGGAS